MNLLQDFLLPKIEKLPCEEPTRAYILYVLTFPHKLQDFSNQSITLAFAEAQARHSFILYQNIADWLLFMESVFPQHLNSASTEYYITLAQISYLNCFKMTYRKLKIYGELSDKFEKIIKKLKSD